MKFYIKDATDISNYFMIYSAKIDKKLKGLFLGYQSDFIPEGGRINLTNIKTWKYIVLNPLFKGFF